MVKALYVGVLVMLLFCVVFGDLQGDEIECSSPLEDLSPCIGFLEGMGKRPSSDCCSNVKKIRSSNPRCLCLLIKDIADPSTGLALNQTLVLQMPTLCQLTDKLSECIDILNLTPSSPDAKIFEMGDAPSPSSFIGSSPSGSPLFESKSNWSNKVQPCLWFSGFVVLAALWFSSVQL